MSELRKAIRTKAVGEIWREAKERACEKRRDFDKANKRVREIDGIIQKFYEDNVTGKIGDERICHDADVL